MKIDKQSLLLKNDRIYLRPLCIEDISDEYICGLNDPEVNRFLVNVRRNVQTRETVGEYVISCYKSSNAILFGIFIKNDDSKKPIGTVHVSEIDLFHYTASLGICIFAKWAWKKAYARQALRLIKKYLFEDVKLHYLEAGVYAENVNSIACFINAGFVEQYRVNNKYRHIDSFEEAIFFAAVNPQFDSSLLQQPILNHQPNHHIF